MKDFKRFKAPYFPKGKIAEITHKYREEHIGNGVPVDVLSFCSKVGLKVYPKDLRGYGMEASLNMLEMTIDVDTRIFNAQSDHRMKFSVAHELGHFLLHDEVYKEWLCFGSVEEYIEFFTNVDDNQYRYLEMHANEFAGAFLVPKVQLWEEYIKRCELPFSDQLDIDIQTRTLGDELGEYFGVSPAVIIKRLTFEGFMNKVKKEYL